MVKIITLQYQTENLQEQFEKLRGEKERALMPLMESVANRFLSDLQKNPANYGVTDFRQESNGYSGGSGYPPSCDSKEYYLVIDGKLIRMRFLQPDISDEEDEWDYITDSILFEGYTQEADKIFRKLKEFVGKQDLEELIRATKKRLDKGSHDFGSEIYDFYFKRGGK
jgi:hypothetical protein